MLLGEGEGVWRSGGGGSAKLAAGGYPPPSLFKHPDIRLFWAIFGRGTGGLDVHGGLRDANFMGPDPFGALAPVRGLLYSNPLTLRDASHLAIFLTIHPCHPCWLLSYQPGRKAPAAHTPRGGITGCAAALRLPGMRGLGALLTLLGRVLFFKPSRPL